MKIKIAVVGCGRIATKHFEAIQQHSDHLDLVAICDINKNILDRYTAELSVSGYTSMLEMLSSVDLDIVAICMAQISLKYTNWSERNVLVSSAVKTIGALTFPVPVLGFAQNNKLS